MSNSRIQNIPTPVFPQLKPGEKAIPLYRGIGAGQKCQYVLTAYAKVDDENFVRFSVHRWLAGYKKDGSFYAKRYEQLNGKQINIFLHREIMGMPRKAGRTPALQVDHIDRDGANNTRANLRVVSRSANRANTRHRRDAKGRFKGVHRVNGKFQPMISWMGRTAYLPLARTEVAAAFSYDHASRLVHGENGNPNDIPASELPSPEEQDRLKRGVEERLRSRQFI